MTEFNTPRWERRLVCYLAHHAAAGLDLAAALALAEANRPEFPRDQLRRLWPLAQQAVRNVALFDGASERTRLCDIKGVKLRPSPQ